MGGMEGTRPAKRTTARHLTDAPSTRALVGTFATDGSWPSASLSNASSQHLKPAAPHA